MNRPHPHSNAPSDLCKGLRLPADTRPPCVSSLPVTDGGAPKPEAAEESAQRPESPQVAPNTIALPVPQANTCEGKPGHRREALRGWA